MSNILTHREISQVSSAIIQDLKTLKSKTPSIEPYYTAIRRIFDVVYKDAPVDRTHEGQINRTYFDVYFKPFTDRLAQPISCENIVKEIRSHDYKQKRKRRLKQRFRVKPVLAWYDLWIGVFIDRPKRRVYVLPLPCIGIVVYY